ncbi:MAG TPA: helix-turn-helix transcriptional regulator [Saprospiraceae bacterium]|nr:helix-turn-helix transcriptional regulator [Saprospiraceae bacterium]
MENSESGVANLTAREQHIIELLHKGLTYGEISSECHIAIGTVKQHVHHILHKMEAPNKTVAINLWLDWKKNNPL